MQEKRRHASGLVHESGEKETHNNRLLAQEFSQLWGHTMVASKNVSKEGT